MPPGRSRPRRTGDDLRPEDVPWHDPVTDLGALMDAAVTEISRYIVAPIEVIHTTVLWCVFAHIIQHEQLGVDFAPRLAIQSRHDDLRQVDAAGVCRLPRSA